jgi:hypothetical protein
MRQAHALSLARVTQSYICVYLSRREGPENRRLLRWQSGISVGATSSCRWLSLRSAEQLVGFCDYSLSQAHLSVDCAVLDWIDDEARNYDADNDFDCVHNEQAQKNPIYGLKV